MPRRGRGRYGVWGKHLEIFELFESWRDDPKAQSSIAVEEGWIEESEVDDFESQVQEGTGAPEGRADFPLFMLTTIRHRMRAAFQRRAATWDQYTGTERAEDFRQHTVSQLNGLTGMGPVPGVRRVPADPQLGGNRPALQRRQARRHLRRHVRDGHQRRREPDPEPDADRAGPHVGGVRVAGRDRARRGEPELHRRAAVLHEHGARGLPAGNEFTGAAAEPTEDNLVTIIEQMRGSTDEDGFPLDITPSNILTKSDRVRLAFKRIMRSQETGTQTRPARRARRWTRARLNPLADDEILPGRVIVEPYLKDPNDWILFAEVSRPAFIVAFLRDQRTPFIGIADGGVRGINGGGPDPYTLDFDEIPYKVRHVFGAALGDPRAAIRARRA
jgi:hypothetical protein